MIGRHLFVDTYFEEKDEEIRDEIKSK